jgi:lipoyl(octanoyl) transferase
MHESLKPVPGGTGGGGSAGRRIVRRQINSNKLTIVPTPSLDAELSWPDRWFHLPWEAAGGVDNMARDLVLLREATAGGYGLLRSYGWRRPTVSFGRNEPVRGVWDVARLRSDGFDVVRRPTGGRALLHADDITWCVVLPLPSAVSWRRAYAAVNERLCTALRLLGIPADVHAESASSPVVPPDGPICFAAPAAGELVVDGAKIGASAVWREGAGYLQHGSFLLRDAQGQLAAYRLTEAAGSASGTPHASRSDAPHAAVLADWLPAGDDTARRLRVTAALLQAFDLTQPSPPSNGADSDGAAAAPPDAPPAAFIPRERLREARAVLAHPDWLWRR